MILSYSVSSLMLDQRFVACPCVPVWATTVGKWASRAVGSLARRLAATGSEDGFLGVNAAE